MYDTFQQACIARGLLDDDGEWNRALSEAVSLLMPKQCRQLFVTILTHCHPAEPNVLWERYKEQLAEDFLRNLPTDQAIQCALAEIDNRLADFGMSCEDRGLPIPNITVDPEQIHSLDDDSIAAYNLSILNENLAKVNDVWDKVENGNSDEPNMFYLDGPAGTGKTMVYNTLISLLRSRGKQLQHALGQE